MFARAFLNGLRYHRKIDRILAAIDSHSGCFEGPRLCGQGARHLPGDLRGSGVTPPGELHRSGGHHDLSIEIEITRLHLVIATNAIRTSRTGQGYASTIQFHDHTSCSHRLYRPIPIESGSVVEIQRDCQISDSMVTRPGSYQKFIDLVIRSGSIKNHCDPRSSQFQCVVNRRSRHIEFLPRVGSGGIETKSRIQHIFQTTRSLGRYLESMRRRSDQIRIFPIHFDGVGLGSNSMYHRITKNRIFDISCVACDLDSQGLIGCENLNSSSIDRGKRGSRDIALSTKMRELLAFSLRVIYHGKAHPSASGNPACSQLERPRRCILVEIEIVERIAVLRTQLYRERRVRLESRAREGQGDVDGSALAFFVKDPFLGASSR